MPIHIVGLDTRRLVVPKVIGKNLHGLTSLLEETKGALIYPRGLTYTPLKTLPEKDYVAYMYITGTGPPLCVPGDIRRNMVVNTFLERNPDYRFVDFHTHSKGTIAKYGKYYLSNFSPGDEEAIRDSFKNNPDYRHLLVTPARFKLVGRNPHTGEVVGQRFTMENYRGFQSFNQIIREAFAKIKKDLGYNLEPFEANRI